MNKKIKKLLSRVLAGVTVLTLLSGCSNSSEPVSFGEGSADDTMTIAVTSFADTLEPTEQYFSWVVSRYGVGETLVKFNEEGELEPCLAEKWGNSDDGCTWTFQIRKNVKFSNGDDLTPELVKSSIERTFEK